MHYVKKKSFSQHVLAGGEQPHSKAKMVHFYSFPLSTGSSVWWSRLGVAVAFWVVALSTLVLSALYDLQLLRVPLN